MNKIKGKFNTRMILSGTMIVAAVAVVAGAAFAFFSDTETSTGNVLAAGAIDLQIDNESYVTDIDGQLVASPETSWQLTDLTVEKFFNFTDLKPGDVGEDTISLHVNSNDAYICAAARVTEDSDVSYTEPETEDDDTVNLLNPLGTDGELAENVNIAFWADDGDNVYEDGENIFVSGLIGDLDGEDQIALADSTTNIWTGSGPILSTETVYVGKAWCFGEMTANGTPNNSATNPLVRGTTGFTCSGASEANNAAQTDRLTGDIQFYAVQSRNNDEFTCSQNYTPEWQTQVIEVGANDLHSGPREVAAFTDQWFFYNDESDEIDNALGSFVAGPGTPPYINGSAEMSVSGTERKNIATYQFKDVKLADIDAMSFATYSQSAGNGSPGVGRAPYLHFNVDFDDSDTWQNRLVYVPSVNDTVTDDTWETWYTGGSSLWCWSKMTSCGGSLTQWPTETGTAFTDATAPYQTWDDIVAAYTDIQTRSTDSWLGIRVGEPYANGFTGNVDNFSITINGIAKTFNFDN